MNLQNLLRTFKKKSFFSHGLPFIIFIVGSSFVLKEFTRVRYDVSKHNKQFGINDEKLKELGINKKGEKVPTLEEEYEQVMTDVNINEWKNIRGPRPWEDDNKEYLDVIQERIKENKNKNRIFSFTTFN